MAGAPTKKRTEQSYERDIRTLKRLRMSTLEHEQNGAGARVVATIDTLVHQLLVMKAS